MVGENFVILAYMHMQECAANSSKSIRKAKSLFSVLSKASVMLNNARDMHELDSALGYTKRE